ncbi:hypothetical protein Aglo03_10140 [Actinokineospora globicatena]|uniref:Uncharacterized protein n=1 Tax=Actinokineospora globicatena TaxID=103729 RepID=A0A9W6V8R6_9PSEU|nr:hypothetical protein Aglo03_10140 [Actinokineospora globicatena]
MTYRDRATPFRPPDPQVMIWLIIYIMSSSTNQDAPRSLSTSHVANCAPNPGQPTGRSDANLDRLAVGVTGRRISAVRSDQQSALSLSQAFLAFSWRVDRPRPV